MAATRPARAISLVIDRSILSPGFLGIALTWPKTRFTAVKCCIGWADGLHVDIAAPLPYHRNHAPVLDCYDSRLCDFSRGAERVARLNSAHSRGRPGHEDGGRHQRG